MWSLTNVAADTAYTLSFRTTPASSSAPAESSPASRSPTGTASRGADVEVVDQSDASGDPAAAPPVESDVLYLGYVDRANDLDLYGFQSTPLAQVGVRLSHLAGDGDLVVYGPAAETPANAPSPVTTSSILPGTPPLAAEDLDVSGVGLAPEPDTDGAVPVLDGLTVIGRSAAAPTPSRVGRRHRPRPAAGQFVQQRRLEPAVRPAGARGRPSGNAVMCRVRQDGRRHGNDAGSHRATRAISRL